MRRRRNEAKRIILAHLARRGWQTPEEVAAVLRWREPRSMYTRMLRFWRWGLVYRRSVPRIEYRLSARGQARLKWLREYNANYDRIAANRKALLG
jgi:hypothetical protein